MHVERWLKTHIHCADSRNEVRAKRRDAGHLAPVFNVHTMRFSECMPSARGPRDVRHFFRFAFAALICWQVVAGQNKNAAAAAATAQIDRGRDLFAKSPKGTPCATCHMLGGVGTAVGPDLRAFVGAVGPRAIVQSIEMSMTAYVQQVKTAGGTFPGFVQKKDGDETDVWDLSQTPPVLKKLTSKDIVSMDNNQTWKHPPTEAGYTSQELADIIAFLKFSATGVRKEVKASDVETSE